MAVVPAKIPVSALIYFAFCDVLTYDFIVEGHLKDIFSPPPKTLSRYQMKYVHIVVVDSLQN